MTHNYRFGYSTTREDGTTVHYDMTAEITDEHIEELIWKADQGDQEALDQAVKFICGCHIESSYKSWLKQVADKNEQAKDAVSRLNPVRVGASKFDHFVTTTPLGGIIGDSLILLIFAGLIYLAFHFGGAIIGAIVAVVLIGFAIYCYVS